ncbi:MAG: carbohydrate ABC transporter substrate-binding protein [Clostridia bacterium]|nr:carbohydrate ABC transporter substrate-binding protein [Clostridia bacterium]
MKRIIAVMLCAVMMLLFASCGSNSNSQTNDTNKNANEIYFLNFKPEVSEVYNEIASVYEKETGVKVKVVTAASDTYETTLKSEIAKSEAPTIFQINGPVGYQGWKNYCLDLKDTKLYSYLIDKDLAVTDGDGVFGIPYVIEGYGIIYNGNIMDKYFNLPEKATDVSSVEEINNFEKLKAVVEDMTKNKSKLGIDGVFASTSMSGGESWRWDSHLASVPFYYEMKEKNSEVSTNSTAYNAKETEFKYHSNYKNLLDLYVNNSVSEKGLLSGKSVNDSMSEFALGKAAMVQNGNWAWAEISKVGGNKVDADNIGYLPLYMDIEGEENQGICIGTENYLAINSKASKEKQQASIDFLEWLFSSETGKKYVTEKLEFITPFNTFDDDETPEDPLAREVLDWMGRDVETIEWTFNSFPSQEFKNSFSDAILEYIQGTKNWDYVREAVVNSWKKERA